MKSSILMTFLSVLCGLAAFGQQQPQTPDPGISVIYQDAAACQRIAGLIGGSILPSSTLPCEQSVFVSAVTSEKNTRAFQVTINYTDVSGNPKSQSTVMATSQTNGVWAASTFFYDVQNITLTSVLVVPLVESTSTLIKYQTSEVK